jgi:hypothetical protein
MRKIGMRQVLANAPMRLLQSWRHDKQHPYLGAQWMFREL